MYKAITIFFLCLSLQSSQLLFAQTPNQALTYTQVMADYIKSNLPQFAQLTAAQSHTMTLQVIANSKNFCFLVGSNGKAFNNSYSFATTDGSTPLKAAAVNCNKSVFVAALETNNGIFCTTINEDGFSTPQRVFTNIQSQVSNAQIVYTSDTMQVHIVGLTNDGKVAIQSGYPNTVVFGNANLLAEAPAAATNSGLNVVCNTNDLCLSYTDQNNMGQIIKLQSNPSTTQGYTVANIIIGSVKQAPKIFLTNNGSVQAIGIDLLDNLYSYSIDQDLLSSTTTLITTGVMGCAFSANNQGSALVVLKNNSTASYTTATTDLTLKPLVQYATNAKAVFAQVFQPDVFCIGTQNITTNIHTVYSVVNGLPATPIYKSAGPASSVVPFSWASVSTNDVTPIEQRVFVCPLQGETQINNGITSSYSPTATLETINKTLNKVRPLR